MSRASNTVAVLGVTALAGTFLLFGRRASAQPPGTTPPRPPGPNPGDSVGLPGGGGVRPGGGVSLPTGLPSAWEPYFSGIPVPGHFYQVKAADLPDGLEGICRRALEVTSAALGTEYATCVRESPWNRNIYGEDASLAFSKVNADVLAVMKSGAYPLGASRTESSTQTEVPTPGFWYQVVRGDNLLTVAGRAYGVSSGPERLQGARQINDSAANAPYRQRGLDANTFGPEGRITFNPVFSCDLVERLRGTRGGHCYATLWIPPIAGPGGDPVDEPAVIPAGDRYGLIWLPPAELDGNVLDCPDPDTWSDGSSTLDPPPEILSMLEAA